MISKNKLRKKFKTKNKGISFNNLERIIKLIIKYNESIKNKKKKGAPQKKHVHEKQRYEIPGEVSKTIINTALDNAKKDNDYMRNEIQTNAIT